MAESGSDSTDSARESSLDVGTVLGEFLLLCRLGSGGMGEVWLADLESAFGIRKLVAVKVILPELARTERERQLFLDEARLTARITHPNVVSVMKLGEDGARIFYVMEWVEGESLRTLLRACEEQAQSIPPGVAGRIMADVCLGLHAAHDLSDLDGTPLHVVHRDVSPHNIMLTEDGIPRLIDFGIAKARVRLAEATGSRAPIGKPDFMAPEQVVNLDVDRRADIWSVGAVLYRMLARRPVFPPSIAVAQLVARAVPSPLPPTVPRPLVDVVTRALAPDPDGRYSTALELARALENALSASGLTTSRAEVADFARTLLEPCYEARRQCVALALNQQRPAQRRNALPPAASPQSISPAELPRRSGKRSGAARSSRGGAGASRASLWIAAAGVVIAAIALAAGMLASSHGPAPPREIAALAPSSRLEPPTFASADPPNTANVDAARAYMTGLQLMCDGAEAAARTEFAHAVKLDPALSAAHLQRALFRMMNWVKVRGADISQIRDDVAAALDSRRNLRRPEAEVLDTLAKETSSDTTDFEAIGSEWAALAERYPREPLVLLATAQGLARAGRHDEAIAAFEKVADYDKKCAVADARRAWIHLWSGEPEEALGAANRCLERSPRAGTCLRRRVEAHMLLGRCDRVEEDVERQYTLEPDSVGAARFWVRMLVAHGAPVETLRAAIRRTSELERTRQSPSSELMNESLVDYVSGNFAAMVRRFPKWEAQWTSEQYERDMGDLAVTELEVLEEIGDRKGAVRVAQLVVQRIRGMLPPMSGSARSLVLAIANREGKRSGLDAAALQSQWLEELRRSSTRAFRNGAWIELVARPVRSSEDARAALALLPEWSPPAPVTLDVWDAESRGRVHLLVGDAEKAIPFLRHSATRCHLSEDWELVDQLHASEELGDALEATGDTAGACSAWGDVVSRWGHAKPRSLTAEKARAGMKRLGCAKPPVAYTQPASLKAPRTSDPP